MAIPLVVVALYYVRLDGLNLSFLPAVNACINGTTFCLLLVAFIAIKRGNVKLHKKIMLSALALSIVFLVSYVAYHASAEETKFGGEGAIRYVYYFVLLTHILLSAAIVPMVLISYVRAINERFDKHKRIARITWPIWLYVTATGVVVYLMISPYYST